MLFSKNIIAYHAFAGACAVQLNAAICADLSFFVPILSRECFFDRNIDEIEIVCYTYNAIHLRASLFIEDCSK